MGLERLNDEFKVVGLRGVSILFASGDSGVGTGGCPNGVFSPDWPSTSPYITSVGGTKLGFLETGTERVWSDSGGGFSNHFPTPAWQQSAVHNYITKYASGLPPGAYWNATGRAYPDIAAFASGFIVVVGGVPVPIDGTSCSCPSASSVFSLVNDHLLNKGQPALGPLNQWIYKNAAAFNDITEGSNVGCAGQDGFPAAPGWDPVTGNGSPLYTKMISVPEF